MLRGNIVEQITVIVMTSRKQNKVPGREASAGVRQGRKGVVRRGKGMSRNGGKEGRRERSLEGLGGWERSSRRMEAAGDGLRRAGEGMQRTVPGQEGLV